MWRVLGFSPSLDVFWWETGRAPLILGRSHVWIGGFLSTNIFGGPKAEQRGYFPMEIGPYGHAPLFGGGYIFAISFS